MQEINLQLHSAKALIDRKLFVVTANAQVRTSIIRVVGKGNSIGDAINNAYDNAQMWAELMVNEVDYG